MASLQGNKASQYGSLYHRSATAPEVSTSRGQRCKARRRSLKDEKVQKETHDGLSERTISVLLAKLHSFEVKEEQDARPSPLRRRDSATGGVGGRRAQIQTQETYGKQVGLLLTNKNGSEEDVREYLEHEANDVFSKGDLPLRPHTMSGPRPFPAPVLMVTVKDLKAAAEERKIKKLGKRGFSGLPPELIPPRKDEPVEWTVAPKDWYTKRELKFMQRSMQMQLKPLLAWRAHLEAPKSKPLQNDQPKRPFLQRRAATAPTRIMSAQNPQNSATARGPTLPRVATAPMRSQSAFPYISTSKPKSYSQVPTRPKTPLLVDMPTSIPARVCRQTTPFDLGSPMYRQPVGGLHSSANGMVGGGDVLTLTRPGTKAGSRVLQCLSFAPT